ncbi:SRPBCC family protein [Nocardioides sp. URHA0020]|uniref:SRPBCC family protein n=1 Tax=Nocardioides sp. URHA0020 TaxID=1380392 RepID=UPI00048EA80D|nr:SRPBCC family protein [Nocardioides sp. URHA0020]
MNPDTRPETTLESSVLVHRPAGVVAAFVLDWGHDHRWRSHVQRFTCTPPGQAAVGQRLVEELRFAGLVFVTPTVVETADELSASYAGGSSAIQVSGRRVVVRLGAERCEVRVTTRLRVGGLLRPFTPLLAPSYRRADAADLRGLPGVLDTILGTAPAGRSER